MSTAASIGGVVLAGGLSRRMGTDKSFVMLGGRPLIAHAVERIGPQVAVLAISANGDAAGFASFHVPVIPDTVPGFAGPLAGILAGLRWAKAAGMIRLATVSVDAPFFPLDLVARLGDASDRVQVALARSAGRLHPVFGLFPVSLDEHLAHYIESDPKRRVTGWLESLNCVPIDFASSGEGSTDPFFNLNTPEDVAVAEEMIAASKLPIR